MRVSVVGTGYVGLVTGACLAEHGHHVVCVDVDQAKIEALRQNRLPIYEPGLEQIVAGRQQDGRLRFTTSLPEALAECPVVMIAVGTPQNEDGSCNLQYVRNVVDSIRDEAKSSKTVIVKSTVPVGTGAELQGRLNDGAPVRHDVASNPEFLREGLAVDDCLNPERIVVGVRRLEVAATLRELYGSYVSRGIPFLVLSQESAEMTKYVANCILATRISFMNEMANLCERVGADVTQVRQGIGLDSRIGDKFLNAGAGYGGSCFPKDTRAMVALARARGVELRILPQVDLVNERQKELFFRKLADHLEGGVEGRTVALWGLAFKPETDDVREAPSLLVIDRLLSAGARVRVFDPQAMHNVEQIYGDRLTYCPSMYDALTDADALGVLTEWSEFRDPDLDRMRTGMSGDLVVDGRNIYDPRTMAAAGFRYVGVGRAVESSDVSGVTAAALSVTPDTCASRGCATT